MPHMVMAGPAASRFRFASLWILLAVGVGVLAYTNLWKGPYPEQQFVHLARAFLEGRTYFIEPPSRSWADTSLFGDRHYWPLGPFPAVLLLPLVLAFGTSVQQGFVSFALTVCNGVLLHRIAWKILGDRERALWLAFSYVFATVYLFVAMVPWSWYFAHVVGTSALLWALDDYFGRRRWALMGLAVGLAFATRISLGLGSMFFVLGILRERGRTAKLAAFLAPLVLCVALVAVYNTARFQDPFETGYRHQLLGPEYQRNREHGLWSLAHFPANAYYLFLKGPDPVHAPDSRVLVFPYLKPDRWGMSILFTSPVFLFLAGLRRRPGDEAAWDALVTALAMLFVTLGNFGIGARQYGYRFALDFSPFLYVMLAYAFREERFGWLPRLLVAGSFLFNLYLIPRVF
jgi:hypothetical protein